MNYNGKQVIDAIVHRLNEENIRCYDSAIVKKIAELSRDELNQLVTSGDVNQWVGERKKQLKLK